MSNPSIRHRTPTIASLAIERHACVRSIDELTAGTCPWQGDPHFGSLLGCRSRVLFGTVLTDLLTTALDGQGLPWSGSFFYQGGSDSMDGRGRGESSS